MINDDLIDTINSSQLPNKRPLGRRSRASSTFSIANSEDVDFINPLSGTLANECQNRDRALSVLRLALKKDQIESIAEFNRVTNAMIKMYSYTTACRALKIVIKQMLAPGVEINSRIVFERLKRFQTFGRNYLTEEEYIKMGIEALLGILRNSVHTLYFSVFLIAAIWGGRFSDARKLNRNDFTKMVANGKIVIVTQKTKTSLILPFHPLANLLLDHWDNRIQMSEKNFYNLMKHHYIDSLKKPKPAGLGFHSLRFRYSNNRELDEKNPLFAPILGMEYKGIPLWEYLKPVQSENVQNAMGHRQIKQTLHYQHTAEVRDIISQEINNGQRDENDDAGFVY